MKMKRSKKIVLIIVIALIITFAISLVLPAAYSPWLPGGLLFMTLQSNRTRVRLLCKTDYLTLLESCRELSKHAARGDLKPGRYQVRGSSRDPKSSNFPKPILDLAPSYVYIDENDSGRVMVEMLGGLGHFGIIAYTEDYKKPFPNFKYGDRELFPGLWYYDDNYERNPKFDKRIDAIMQKGK